MPSNNAFNRRPATIVDWLAYCVLALFITPTICVADTWYVATDGNDLSGTGTALDPFASLQRAAQVAIQADTISVADGVYVWPEANSLELGNKHLSILSQSGDPALCIFDLGGADGISYQKVLPESDDGLSVNGLSFRNGGTAVSAWGVAPWDGGTGSMTCRITNCHFENNHNGLDCRYGQADIVGCVFLSQSTCGLALDQATGSTVDCQFVLNDLAVDLSNSGTTANFAFDNTVFVRNGRGPRLFVDFGTVNFTSCRVDSTEFQGIRFVGGEIGRLNLTACQFRWNGYGICMLEYAGGSFTDCEVSNSTAAGIYCSRGSAFPDLTLSNVVITGNQGWGISDAAARSQKGTQRGVTTLDQCRIQGNDAGGVQGSGYQYTVQQCVVADNGGDGLHIEHGYGYGTQYLELLGNTIAGNDGYGIWSDHDSISLASNIIAFNSNESVKLTAATTLSIDCCDVYGNLVDYGNDLSDWRDVSGNISRHPLFCRTNSVDPYTLGSSSPCLDENHTACGLIGALGNDCSSQCGPVWYVATDGDDIMGDGSREHPFETIQCAVSAAAPTDTVVLFDGVFSGTGNHDVDLSDRSMRIRSDSGDATSCIIDLAGNQAFTCTITDPTISIGPTFSGLTFRNGSTAVVATGRFTKDREKFYELFNFWNCRFEHNTIGTTIRYGRVDVRDCVFYDNSSKGLDLIETKGTIAGSRFEANGKGLYEDSFLYLTVACDSTVFVRNETGVGMYIDIGTITLTTCRLDSNTVDGIWSKGSESGTLSIVDCLIRDNLHDGLSATQYLSLNVTDSVIKGNGNAGIYSYQAPANDLNVSGTAITDNDGWGIARDIYREGDFGLERDAISVISDCMISNNDLGGIQGGGYDYTIEMCVVVDNGGDGLHIEHGYGYGAQHLQVLGNTIAGNSGIGVWSDHEQVTLQNTVLAFNGGESVEFTGSPTLDVACCDVYGNTVDYGGGLMGFESTDYNLALDPDFCGMDEGDYTLLDISPCLATCHPAGPQCGLIGALDSGCSVMPTITEIADVGNDQGGQVRLVWQSSHLDSPQAINPIQSYSIYRRQDASRTRTISAGPHLSPRSQHANRLLGWDFITSVPVRGDAFYQCVAPTLCDLTLLVDAPPDTCWTTYFVSALTADPYSFYDSVPDSGFSIDNLAPSVPTGLEVVYSFADTVNNLSWEECPDEDFRYFRIYIEPDKEVAQGLRRLVHTTTETSWVDPDGTAETCYALVAVDFAGNESDASQPVYPSPVSGGLPGRCRLGQCRPNPFNPGTIIDFELARPGRVDLTIFDLSGRIVRHIISGTTLSAGSYAKRWNGCDGSGRLVAAGVYFYRLQTDGFTATRRMVLIK